MQQEALGMVETKGLVSAIEAADIVIMNDKPSRIATVMGISRKTLNIVIQNISLAFIALLLAIIGMTTDPFGAVILVAATIAPVAYENGIHPTAF